MFLSLLAMAVVQGPWPFDGEPAAAQAASDHAICLRDARFSLRDDDRTPPVLASEIIAACRSQRDALATALMEVYERKPALLEGSRIPAEAANGYVDARHRNVEPDVAWEQIGRAYKRCLQRQGPPEIVPSRVEWATAWSVTLAACSIEREHLRQVTSVRWSGLGEARAAASADWFVASIEEAEVGRRRISETISQMRRH